MNSSNPVSIEIIDSEEQLISWKRQWLDAFRAKSKMDLSCSFHDLGSDFLHLMGERDERMLYVMHRAGQLLALIAIKPTITKIFNRIPVRTLSTGGHFVTNMLIAEGASNTDIDTLFRQLISDFPDIAWIDMNRITTDLYNRLLSWAADSTIATCSSHADARYCFDVHQRSFDQFYQQLGKKTRTNMRYYQRLLEREHGKVQFEFISPNTDSENTDRFEEFLSLENSGWKGAQNSSILGNHASAAYHRKMSFSAHAERQMLWARCSVNAKPIAMMFIISRSDRLWAVKIAYDEKYRRYSPGAILTFKLIEHGFIQPEIESITMMTHYDWLKRWKPDSEAYYAIRIFPPSLKANLCKYLLLYRDWQLISA